MQIPDLFADLRKHWFTWYVGQKLLTNYGPVVNQVIDWPNYASYLSYRIIRI